MSWGATVLTVLPEMFPGPLGISLCGKALAEARAAGAVKKGPAEARTADAVKKAPG